MTAVASRTPVSSFKADCHRIELVPRAVEPATSTDTPPTTVRRRAMCGTGHDRNDYGNGRDCQGVLLSGAPAFGSSSLIRDSKAATLLISSSRFVTRRYASTPCCAAKSSHRQSGPGQRRQSRFRPTPEELARDGESGWPVRA